MARDTRNEDAIELDIIAFPLAISDPEGEALLVIAEDSVDTPENCVSDCGMGRRVLGRKPTSEDPWTIRSHSDQATPDSASVRLLEHTRYQIRLCRRDEDRSMISETNLLGNADTLDSLVDSTLENAESAEWKFDPKSGTGEMKVKGHYGGASIRVGDREIRLDFVSADLDYESEYRAMLEDIAQRFESIVATWGGPTTYPTTRSDETAAETLLGQFVLARGLLEAHRLEYAARAIERNPDTIFERSESWRPVANADPRTFLKDPVGKGRGWRETEEDRFPVDHMPEEVKHSRNRETADTPINRFVKHVLRRFEDIFRRVVEQSEISGSPHVEASGLANDLTKIIDRPFWKEIGALSQPASTVTGTPLLRKREGYRQVFRAWLGLRSSLSVDWEGASDLFQGPVRKTSKLYEYWLFFVLRDCLSGMAGLEEKVVKDRGDARAFIKEEGERLAVRLSGGKASVTEFRDGGSESQELCVLLFYNRGFSRDTDHLNWGSYSKKWRPDFSVAIFPSKYRVAAEDWEEAEKIACDEKDASYVHFEAKYKPSSSSESDGKGPSSSDFAELHAYLDGICGSESSFLLYPGETGSPDGVQNFYPRSSSKDGVGEAVLRPGPSDQSEVGSSSHRENPTFLANIIRTAMQKVG